MILHLLYLKEALNATSQTFLDIHVTSWLDEQQPSIFYGEQVTI